MSNDLILYETSHQDGRFSHGLSAAHNIISWKLRFCFIRLFSSGTYLSQQLSLLRGKDMVLCISASASPPALLAASNICWIRQEETCGTGGVYSIVAAHIWGHYSVAPWWTLALYLLSSAWPKPSPGSCATQVAHEDFLFLWLFFSFFSSKYLKHWGGCQSLPEWFIFSTASRARSVPWGMPLGDAKTLENITLPLFNRSELLNLPRLSSGLIQSLWSYFIWWDFIWCFTFEMLLPV